MEYSTSGDGNPIILLNGIFMSTESWQAFLDNFDRFYQIICFNFPNQGDLIQVNKYFSMYEYAKYAKSIIDKAINDTNESILIGMSFGGLVAYILSKIFHIRFKCIILICCSPFLSRKNYRQRREYISDLYMSDLDGFAKEYFKNIYSDHFVRNNPGIIEQSIDVFKNKYSEYPVAAHNLVKALEEFYSDPAMPDSDCENPINIIAARYDKIVDYEDLKNNANRKMIPFYTLNTGHSAITEDRIQLFRTLDCILQQYE